MVNSGSAVSLGRGAAGTGIVLRNGEKDRGLILTKTDPHMCESARLRPSPVILPESELDASQDIFAQLQTKSSCLSRTSELIFILS